ncbi:MAG: thioredoxin 2 [Miltoncostaeaceae bacterium]|jgi:thioredoxin 2|nr:thioredoxin 2 [Miltoncostaeaceae bacterium]
MTTATGTVVACPACGKRSRVRAHPSAVPKCGGCGAYLPWSVEADSASFDAETHAGVPVVVDFWAPWCGPCRQIAPALEMLARKHAGRLKVVRLNVDDAQELAARYRAMSIPLLVVMSGGEEVDRSVGARPPAELERWLSPHLGTAGG